MDQSLGYRLRPVVKLHWATWDGEYVVFEESSGQTHLLDAIRALMLDFFIEAPRTTTFFTDFLTQSLEVTSSDATEVVTLALGDFERLGLVEEILS